MAKKTARKVAAKKVAPPIEAVEEVKAAPIIAHVVRTSIDDRIQAIIDEITETRTSTRNLDIALTNLRKSIVWLNR